MRLTWGFLFIALEQYEAYVGFLLLIALKQYERLTWGFLLIALKQYVRLMWGVVFIALEQYVRLMWGVVFIALEQYMRLMWGGGGGGGQCLLLWSNTQRRECIQVRNCKRIYLICLLCFDSFGSVTVSLVTVSHTKHGFLNPFRSALTVFSCFCSLKCPLGYGFTLLFCEVRICEFIQSPSHLATFHYMNYRMDGRLAAGIQVNIDDSFVCVRQIFVVLMLCCNKEQEYLFFTGSSLLNSQHHFHFISVVILGGYEILQCTRVNAQTCCVTGYGEYGSSEHVTFYLLCTVLYTSCAMDPTPSHSFSTPVEVSVCHSDLCTVVG